MSDRDAAPGTPGEDVPERPGTAAFARALNVKRNGRIGVAAGASIAALVYAVRVFELLGPVPGSDAGPGPVLFLALAFVLGVGVALLVTLALTLVSASRAARRL
ncbi:DUF7536 family protein [Halomarina ordinaria]|uniref:Cox cluster protein n=1 Tax=Halomarina ordinaria TaxID=3033939 RepID=A0ABD5UCL9_9EURY|nr:hypothetical protein [Halomarina sp. PSRA2]